MLSPQVQVIQMAKVKCNLAEHQGKSIKTLCLNPACKESTFLCSKCIIKGHPQCRDHILELVDIPKQLTELQQLQLAVVALKEKINNQFKELLSRIEQFLQTISKYQESPNLTNLDGVGLLLRKLPKQSILQSLDESKIKIMSLFDNQNHQEEKVSEPSAEDWYEKGMIDCSYYQDKQYLDKVKLMKQLNALRKQYRLIQIMMNIGVELLQGLILAEYGKLDEAIKCFERGQYRLIQITIRQWYLYQRPKKCQRKYKKRENDDLSNYQYIDNQLSFESLIYCLIYHFLSSFFKEQPCKNIISKCNKIIQLFGPATQINWI